MNYQVFKIEDDKMPGFNEMIKAAKTFGTTGKRFNAYAAMKKKWGEKIGRIIKQQHIFSVDKLFLYLIWFEPNRRRDPDNIAAFIKFILDALQKEKIIDNDGWKNISGWKNKFIITRKRGVEVRLYENEDPEYKDNT